MSRALYCGDHDLSDAARYLAGALAAARIPFDYLPSNAVFARRASKRAYGLYILSDYPSRFLGRAGAERIAREVRAGAGLLMIGGWGSFTGADGHYGRTALADALPVRCLPRDDRRQGAAAYRIAAGSDVGCLGKPRISFSTAPTLAGFNQTILKPGAAEILKVHTLAWDSTNTRAKIIASDPLLAAWTFGCGRVTAFCTDLAPHWSGGLTDWGKRVKVSAAPGIHAEVGAAYLDLVSRMIRITMSRASSAG